MKAEAKTEIRNKYGFHARPSTSFSILAKQYKSDIAVYANGMDCDGKSIMGLMSLGAPQGTVVRIVADGEDAEAAVAALKAHIECSFGGIE